jgi:AAHS family 3-hydroxyphenylpropionic acid transporter
MPTTAGSPSSNRLQGAVFCDHERLRSGRPNAFDYGRSDPVHPGSGVRIDTPMTETSDPGRGGQTPMPPASEAPHGRTRTAALCFAAMILEGFDIQAMGLAAGGLASGLGLSRDLLGQALAASNIGLVFGAVLGGWLADSLGRRRVLAASVALFGVFTLLTTAATDFATLFAARLGAGIGFGAALANIMAIAGEIAPRGKAGLTAAVMFCGMPVGGGLVALLSHFGGVEDWRALFFLGGGLPLALAPILATSLALTPVERAKGGTNGLSWLWLAALPLGGLAWWTLQALTASPDLKTLSLSAPWIAAVLGVLAAYLLVHARVLFAEGRAFISISLWVVFFPTLLMLYLILNWLPTLIAGKGLPEIAGLASAAFNFAGVVGALVMGASADRFGLRIPLTVGFIALLAVIAALSAATDPVLVLCLSGGVGFLLLGCNYALYGAGSGLYPHEMRGRGSGAAIAWGRLGSVAGPLVGGFLMQSGSTSAAVVSAMTPFALVSAAGVLMLAFASRGKSAP